MDIAFSSGDLLIAVIVVIAAIVGGILLTRQRFRKRTESNLAEKYQESGQGNVLAARNKYPEVDPFRLSNTTLIAGIAVALALVVMAFNWTQFENRDTGFTLEIEEFDEVEIEPPRTAEPPPPPPPPPPPVIEEVPEEEIEEEDEPIFEDQDIEVEDVVEEAPPPPAAAPPPPPPPPPPKPAEPEIFKVVEDMPRFPGCEKEKTKAEKKQCSDLKLQQFLAKNIKYPAIARENGIEGRAIVRFVVDERGKISQAEVLRDPGGGLGQEAMRVVNKMNDMKDSWVPGKQRGKAVKVWFTLPVNFRLE